LLTTSYNRVVNVVKQYSISMLNLKVNYVEKLALFSELSIINQSLSILH